MAEDHETDRILIDGIDLHIPAELQDLRGLLQRTERLRDLELSPSHGYRLYRAERGLVGSHREAVRPELAIQLNGEGSAAFEIRGFNSADDRDPDAILVSSGEDRAWLEYDLSADLKGAAGGSVGDAVFGLDVAAGARLLTYLPHEATEPLGPALRADLASLPFVFRSSDVESLAEGATLAYLVRGRLAFHAELTWSDVLTSSVRILDDLLEIAGGSSFRVATGARAAFAAVAEDDYRLIFRGTASSRVIIELRKTASRARSAQGSLGVEIGFTDPDGLREALETYLSGRLGIDGAQALLDRIESAARFEMLNEGERRLAGLVADRLGFEDLQGSWEAFRRRVDGLWKKLDQVLKKALSARLRLAFELAYSRIATEEAILACEVEADAIARHHGELLLGDYSGLTAALAGGERGYRLVEYLKTGTETTRTSFGIDLSIGAWAARGQTEITRRWTRQEHLDGHERLGFDGRRSYTASWGSESYRYAFELSASMEKFSAEKKAKCSELDFALGFSWLWIEPLDHAVLQQALDTAVVWGIVSEQPSVGLPPGALGKRALVEVEIAISDDGVETLLAVGKDDLFVAWATGMAAALPRVQLGSEVFRDRMNDRIRWYAPAARWLLEQSGGAAIEAVLGRIDYPVGTPEPWKRADLGTGLPAGGDLALRSLPVLWRPAPLNLSQLPCRLAARTFETLSDLSQGIASGGRKKLVRRTFEKLQELVANKPYDMRLLGHVLAGIVRRNGSASELTGAVRITLEDSGETLVVA